MSIILCQGKVLQNVLVEQTIYLSIIGFEINLLVEQTIYVYDFHSSSDEDLKIESSSDEASELLDDVSSTSYRSRCLLPEG